MGGRGAKLSLPVGCFDALENGKGFFLTFEFN